MNDSSSLIKPLNGRFAPSPTGDIHAGTIFAALQVWLISRSTGGKIVMRIEDLDPERSKKTYADSILRNFERLGLSWDEGPFWQHGRNNTYEHALEIIKTKAKLYSCVCTRVDLRSASAVHLGEHTIYNRRCLERLDIASNAPHAKRIFVPYENISFNDLYQGEQDFNLERQCGDFILKRSDGGFAYQLAVVVDDAQSGINCVARGVDLLLSTPQQIYLHKLLGNDIPTYAHFPLFCAPDGKRLAKRNKDASFEELLQVYKSPEGVLGHIAFVGGLIDCDIALSPEEILEDFSIDKMREIYKDRIAITYK